MKAPSWRRRGFIPRLILGVIIAGLVVAWTSQASLRDPAVVESTLGIVGRWNSDDGDLFFTIQGRAANYAVRTQREGDDELRDVLQDSEDSGNSLRVSLHLDGASFELWSDQPRYWVKTLEYQGKTYGPFEPRRHRSWRKLPEAEAALLRGVAYESAGKDEQAVRTLEAVDFATLPGRLRPLAFKTRASAREDLAYPQGTSINADSDELLVKAVRDYREAAKLDPDDSQLLLWQGNALLVLGDYDQALKMFAEVGKRWPDKRFVATIRRATAHRLREDYHASLRALEEIKPPEGATGGMMYHYHRAWTLTKVERYQEAVREIGFGLETQPDYAWANGRRACALAQLGRLDEAIADTRVVITQLENTPEQAAGENLADLRARYAEQLRALEAASASAPSQPTAVACHDEPDNPHYSRREPSRLLREL